MKRLYLVAALGLAMLAAVDAQDQPSFRAGTSLVPIYVTVTDEAGRLVPDLTADDFEVRDNGRRKPLVFFTSDSQPVSVVVMLDRSGTMADNFDLIRDAAREFIGQMQPADRARIGSFSDEIRIDPDGFSGDRTELSEILHDRLQEAGPSPVWTAIDRSITALQPREGRRVVLVFSDGYDDPGRNQVRTTLDDVRRRARINEIMVYAIGFAVTTSRLSGWSMPQGSVGGGRYPVPQRPASISRRVQKPHPGLKTLAEESGGGYFELHETEDLNATFVRVAEELHRQYLLAIATDRLDGTTHELEVKVKRRGAEARARKTYIAEARK
ncbi:MAG TPA: VWA domain-containing protein [Vicinamibacterales bacterium]|nr:VWA domain-containing protein [Vicinamibacterales bacterium]